MTADKMFAELGYIKIAKKGNTIIYEAKEAIENCVFTKTISFYKDDKDISVEAYLEDEPELIILEFAELQAIMAKIKELGWE